MSHPGNSSDTPLVPPAAVLKKGGCLRGHLALRQGDGRPPAPPSEELPG